MTKKRVNYGCLTLDKIPAFAFAYKDFYTETEKGEMSVEHQQNYLNTLIAQHNNPDNLFVVASVGKRIVGILSAVGMPALDGVASLMCECVYVQPEYRREGVGKTLIGALLSWAKRRGYQRIFAVQNPNDNKWTRKHLFGAEPYKTLIVRRV